MNTIYIITGKVNQGKTTKLLSIYNEIKKGDGFYNSKVYLNNSYAGQEIVRLSTSESRILTLKKEFIPRVWDEEYSYNVFSFSKNGISFAESIVNDILKKDIHPIFIDEIGPLELQGKGFHDIFNTCLKTSADICVVIRESCVGEAIKKFNIANLKKIEFIHV